VEESKNGSEDQTLGTGGEDSFAALAAALNSLRDAVRSLEVTIRAQPSQGAGPPAALSARPAPSVAVAERSAGLTDADEWLLERALKDPASKFARLYRGEWRELGYKERAHAEMALLCKLAWTCKGDAGQMRRIFQTSRLMSSRFSEEGAEMIEKAIDFARQTAPERFDEAS
jgi:hypothetical protein